MKYSLIILLLLSLISCKEDIDITAPQLILSDYSIPKTETQICGFSDPNVFHLKSSDTFSFKALFQDDVALSQYKIDIHENFDCHGHGEGSAPGISLPNVPNQTEDWALIEIGDLEGVEVEKNFQLTVPDNVTAGSYHFSIQVIDLAGNSPQDLDIFSLKILNKRDTIAPMLDIVEPIDNSFAIERGKNLIFRGKVMDNQALNQGGNGMVYVSYVNLSTGNNFSTNAYQLFTEGNSEEEFELNYSVPLTLTRGNYRFIVGAFDGVRNAAPVQQFQVEIL